MKIYLYGMICGSNSFKLDEFPTQDEYTEIQQSYRFPGGETGTCATVLASLGIDVKIDGTHIGRSTSKLV
ncbi:MAG: carbohydrate kinase family protein, partial [Oscillospiraceae bacterium]|nr:carbohydrate kinase family protein [Oscillospiraceae bacterium]